MAIQYTPAVALPYPQVTDTPWMASRDMRDLALKADSVVAQVKGESTAALAAAEAAETTADAALAHALRVEFPIEYGTTPPADEDKLWVDEGDTLPAETVAWGDLADKPTSFPPSAHGHQIGDVTGLQAALDAAGAEDWDAAIAALNTAAA